MNEVSVRADALGSQRGGYGDVVILAVTERCHP